MAVVTLDELAAGSLTKGDIVTFGQWGGCPIDWLILDNSKEILLITKMAIDCFAFNGHPEEECFWKPPVEDWWMQEDNQGNPCSLRWWLDGLFFPEAFGLSNRPEYPRLGLLTPMEAEHYFEGADARVCHLTEYAQQSRGYASESTACAWWLDPGCELSPNYVPTVYVDGRINPDGCASTDSRVGVRPVLRGDLDSWRLLANRMKAVKERGQ